MSHLSSLHSHNTSSCLWPPPQRRNIAAGHRLAPLPQSTLTRAHRQVSSAQTTSCATRQSSSTVSSTLQSVPTGASIRSSSKYDQHTARRVRCGSQPSHPPRNHASSVSPQPLTVIESVQRPSSQTEPLCRGRSTRRTACGPLLEDKMMSPTLSAEALRGPSVGVERLPTSQNHRKPRPPGLQRSAARALGNGFAKGKEPRIPGAAINDAAAPQPHAHPDRTATLKKTSATSLSGAANHAANDVHTSHVGTETGSSSDLAQNGTTADAPLPYAPRDMDELFFTDRRNWTTKEDLPGLAWSLLEGMGLEAPYTTYLWTQAYKDPADLLAALRGKASALPDSFLHCWGRRRTNGFYACVRCGTPVCDPSHQVITPLDSLRGIAVFDALHADGVTLRVCTPASRSTAPRVLRERHYSVTCGLAATPDPQGECGAAQCDLVPGGLRFLVHCCHCDGCLGAMRLGEATHAGSAEEEGHTSSVLATATTPADLTTKALFFANSVCLQYMPYSTRARLDQTIVDPSSFDFGAQSSGSGRGAGMTSGDFAAAPALSGPWGLGDALEVSPRSKQGATHFSAHGVEDDDDDDGLDAAFDSLLEELNPYSAPVTVSSDGDFDV
ncbi:hypothetical protein JKF63_05115 [Porcisia hertigi]|uniref:Uncharacterized protein n=1 Tax=Porcisia hertigi TaxID=2761500 RepID=A0A836IAB3_9TRYP|nr:hypothetical protein JKF63_05115 [Porcisia hertigi]